MEGITIIKGYSAGIEYLLFTIFFLFLIALCIFFVIAVKEIKEFKKDKTNRSGLILNSVFLGVTIVILIILGAVVSFKQIFSDVDFSKQYICEVADDVTVGEIREKYNIVGINENGTFILQDKVGVEDG